MSAQKRKSSSLLDARMAKIYRGQRHSQEGDDSASDDDDDGQLIVDFYYEKLLYKRNLNFLRLCR